MPRLEEFSNRLADQDWTWWPLVSLRPGRDEPMTHRTVGRTTLFFGPVTALLTASLLWLIGEHRVPVLLSVSLPTMLCFYCFMRGVTARYWNRRAERLRRGQAGDAVATT